MFLNENIIEFIILELTLIEKLYERNGYEKILS